MSQQHEVDQTNAGARRKPRGVFALRPYVVLAVFLAAGVGIIFHTGWGTLSSMGWRAVAWVCPLGALETLLAGGSDVLRTGMALGVTVVLTLVFGKAFCSWVCPVPSVAAFFRPSGKRKTNQDDLSDACLGSEQEKPGDRQSDAAVGAKESEDLHTCKAASSSKAVSSAAKARSGASAALAPIGGKRDGFAVDTRHGVLVGALASIVIFGFPVFCLVCPVGLVFGTVICVWGLLETHVLTWGLVIFPVLLILEVTLLRSWCHRFCPIGALLSLISQFNHTFVPRVKAGSCMREHGVGCTSCVDACPEKLDPHTGHIPECSKCGKCVSACPAHAIEVKLFAKK